jgi:hypothetical protein
MSLTSPIGLPILHVNGYLGGEILRFQEALAVYMADFLPLVVESGSLGLYIEGLLLVVRTIFPHSSGVSSALTIYYFLNSVVLSDAKAKRITMSVGFQ